MSQHKDIFDEHDEIVKKIENAEKKFTAFQKQVVEILVGVMEGIPYGFFESKTLEELNTYFGGHDDMIVDEPVREYLQLVQELDQSWDEIIGCDEDGESDVTYDDNWDNDNSESVYLTWERAVEIARHSSYCLEIEWMETECDANIGGKSLKDYVRSEHLKRTYDWLIKVRKALDYLIENEPANKSFEKWIHYRNKALEYEKTVSD